MRGGKQQGARIIRWNTGAPQVCERLVRRASLRDGRATRSSGTRAGLPWREELAPKHAVESGQAYATAWGRGDEGLDAPGHLWGSGADLEATGRGPKNYVFYSREVCD